MIRVFNIFCKIKNFLISAAAMYEEAIKEIDLKNVACPYCNTKDPAWSKHATYSRYLISYSSHQGVLYERITVTRYRCSSCNHTHAILPEMIVPYNMYSIVFILHMLCDYFSGSYTVNAICAKYDISISTLYKWKELFEKQEKLWLNVIDKLKENHMDFIKSFFKDENSRLHKLKNFFDMCNRSFLQYISKKQIKVRIDLTDPVNHII